MRPSCAAADPSCCPVRAGASGDRGGGEDEAEVLQQRLDNKPAVKAQDSRVQGGWDLKLKVEMERWTCRPYGKQWSR